MNKQIAIVVICFSLSIYIFLSFRPKVVTEKESLNDALSQIESENNISDYEKAYLKVELAVLDHTIRNENTPPDSLESLIPRYFDTVPLNPETGESFRYQAEGENYVIGEYGSLGGTTSKKGKSNKATKSIVDGPLGEQEFINPNEMKLDDFVYTVAGKRDPFLPFSLSRRVDVDSSKHPLTRFTLGQLRVTAILKGGDGNYFATVETTTGKGHVVKPGAKIGDAGGEVVEITDKAVKILESHKNFKGEKVNNSTELKLQKSTSNSGGGRSFGRGRNRN